jgi:hypothetical protein
VPKHFEFQMILMKVPRDTPRSLLIGMALAKCAHCRGTGLVLGSEQVCRCVDRSVFRACLNRFQYCEAGAECVAPVALESAGISGPRGRTSYGRKNEEYTADFYLVAKRSLPDPVEWGVFRLHFQLGRDWKVCCRALGINRGNFFHTCYRVEAKLGRVFRELKPYPMYPHDEYFHGTVRSAKAATLLRQEPRRAPLRPPLRQPLAEAA